MGIVNKSKPEEIKNICELIRNSELQTENQTAKSDTFEILEAGMDAIDNSQTKENMFFIFDKEELYEEIAENVNEKNIEALEEKFKNDTFPSTVIRPVKQYNGHDEIEITEAGRKACAESIIRFSEGKSKILTKPNKNI